MDCSLPGSSVHRICQARVLEWGAIAFSTHETLADFYLNGGKIKKWGADHCGLAGSLWVRWGTTVDKGG